MHVALEADLPSLLPRQHSDVAGAKRMARPVRFEHGVFFEGHQDERQISTLRARRQRLWAGAEPRHHNAVWRLAAEGGGVQAVRGFHER